MCNDQENKIYLYVYVCTVGMKYFEIFRVSCKEKANEVQKDTKKE